MIPVISELLLEAGVALSNLATKGLKVKTGANTSDWTWEDLTCTPSVDTSGQNAPSATELFDTGIQDYGFNASDVIRCRYHIRHDIVIGGNKYLHSHLGKSVGSTAAAGGTFVLTHVIKYCYNADRGLVSPAPITITQTLSAATFNQVLNGAHKIVDTLIAQSGGGTGLFNSDLWLPDDTIYVTTTFTTVSTITAVNGLSTRIFCPFQDIHTQVRGIGTKNKDLSTSSFYV